MINAMKSTTKRCAVGLSMMLLSAIAQVGAGCSKPTGAPSNDNPSAGHLTGVARDQAGNPLQGVRVLVDHSVFYNSNISTFTDAAGRYRVKVPQGSWYAFAQQDVEYNGKKYRLDLHPENPAGFGGEGGVRNFTWRLSGTKPEPLSGNYGGLVTIDNFPGVYLQETEIDFVLTPVGLLIDGSQGEVMRVKTEDGHTIKDIPMGRYQLTATFGGKPVLFRPWNSEGAFVANYRLDFEPQIAAQCDNCMKLEYYWEN